MAVRGCHILQQNRSTLPHPPRVVWAPLAGCAQKVGRRSPRAGSIHDATRLFGKRFRPAASKNARTQKPTEIWLVAAARSILGDHMETPRVRLGELLVRAGLISADHLEEALAEQKRVGKRLGTVLVHSGLVSETQVTQVLSQQLSVPWVSLHHIDFSRDLLNLVPLDLVERYCLIPIYVRRVRGLGDALYIAMDDPTNSEALTEVAERSRLHVRAMIAPPSDIRAALRAYYGVGVDEEPAPAPRAAAAPAVRPDETPMPGAEAPRLARPPMATAAPKKPPAASSLAPATPEEAAAAPTTSVAPSKAGSLAALGPPLSSRAEDGKTESVGPRPDGARAMRTGKGAKMIALTLLDGTTIRLPAKPKPVVPEAEGRAPPPEAPPEQLTARDLIVALRAAARGADATAVLGENARWEAMFAAVLSVLLKKHLIADWEFVEELKKG
jgi:type IV pilus assembly protein PilB